MKAPNTQEQRAEASHIPMRGRKERKAMLPETTSGVLNESRARTQCSRRAARNNPTWGCLGTPGSGQGRNQPQGTPKGGGYQRGLGVFCTRGSRGNSSMEPPAGTLHLPDSEPFGLSHERQPAGQWRRVQKNVKRVRFSVFLPHTCT